MLEILNSTHAVNPTTQSHAENALKHLLSRKDLGFTQAPLQKEWVSSIQKTVEPLKQKYKKFVVVGFGGSSLGARAIQEIFDRKNLFFIDNVDSIGLERSLQSIGVGEDVLWIFISKSGNTIELVFLLDVLRETLAQKNINLAKHSFVVTENTPNPLKKWAEQNNCPTFDFPKDIGGRFSVLSSVGMLPAALMNLDVGQFYKGAQAALSSEKFITDLSAQFYESFQRQEWITQFWFYSSEVSFFSRWLVQLWSESLAKKVNRQGQPAPRCSTPMACFGSTDQHSVLQQVSEGARDKFVVFHAFESCEQGSIQLEKPSIPDFSFLRNRKIGSLLKEQSLATEESLRIQGISTLFFKSKVLDEAQLGYLFMMYELVVGVLGEMMDINAFDQPGVELGKRLTLKKLNNL